MRATPCHASSRHTRGRANEEKREKRELRTRRGITYIAKGTVCAVCVCTLEPSFVRCVLCTASMASSSSLVSKERSVGSSDPAPNTRCSLSFFLSFLLVSMRSWTEKEISCLLDELQQLYSGPAFMHYHTLPCDIDVVVALLFETPFFFSFCSLIFSFWTVSSSWSRRLAMFSFLLLFLLRRLLRTHRHRQIHAHKHRVGSIPHAHSALLCRVPP